jgi:peptide/nickel transport system substrate-binding protein/oligopeptide transport system substrate-binding protein
LLHITCHVGQPILFAIFIGVQQTMKQSWLSTLAWRGVAGFGALMLMMGVTACAPEAAQTSGQDRSNADTLIRLSDAEIRGLDPQKVSDLAAIRVARDQFEGLTRFNGKGEAEAGLAKDWQISADGKIWTFALRNALEFSDGQPITAQVFADMWQRLQADETASPHKALFAAIDDVTAPNAKTVQVILTNPYPELPALLAHPAMAALPMHRIAAAGDAWTSDRPMVTSGPYRASSWVLNDRLSLDSNPRWHGGKPAIANVAWKPSDDALNGMRQVLGGAADIASDYPANRHQWLTENYAQYVHVSDYLGTYYFAFNTRRPPFDNALIRQALSISVDRKFLTEDLIAMGNKPAWSVVPPALSSADNDVPEYLRAAGLDTANKAEILDFARKQLAHAGYDAANPLRFEIRINTSREHKRVAVALAAMWAELPVQASILNTEASLHFASLRRGDFDLARSGWIADLPTAENFLNVHTLAAGPSNYSGYNKPIFDRAMRLGRETGEQRYFERANDQLMADMPILPLYHYTARSLVSPRISGWHDNPLNIHPSADLSLRNDN